MKLFDPIFLLIFLLISFSLGNRVLRIFKLETNMSLENFCFAIGIGLGVLAYTVFFLGIFSLLYSWIIYLLLVLLFLFSLRNFKILFQQICLVFKKTRDFRNEKVILIVGFLLCIHLLIAFICALAPVTDWDSQVEHLAVPKIYIQHHAIIPIPLRPGSDYPFLMEMLYMLGMLLHSDILASLIHWLMAGMTLLTLFLFGRKFFSAKVGILAAAIFFSCPLVSFLSTGALIDMGLCFFAFLALYGFVEWFLFDRKGMFILSALFCGLTVGTKYTGLVPLVIILGSIGFKSIFIKKESILQALKRIAYYGSVSLLVFAPWLIKNFVYRGNPFYPFFSSFFGGEKVPIELNFVSVNPFNYFRYLFYLWDVTVGTFEGWVGSISVFYYAFVPILLFIRKKENIIRYLIIYSLAGITFFYFFAQRARYNLPFFIALAVVVAYAIERLREGDNLLRKILPPLVIFPLLINLGIFSGLVYIRLPVVLGFETRDAYLSRRIKTYDAILYINKKLDNNAKILFFDSRAYYCDREYIVGDIIPIQKVKEKDEALKTYKELGLTHVLVNKGEWVECYWRQPHTQLVPKHLKLIYKKNEVYLYEIVY